MAKDLEITAKLAAEMSNSARKDEALRKLIDAWNSKNAKAATRLGTFGFMAAALAACGGSSGGGGTATDTGTGTGTGDGGTVTPNPDSPGDATAGLPDDSIDDTSPETIFRLINDIGVFDASDPVVQDGLLTVTRNGQINLDPVADGRLEIAEGETYVGDIALFSGENGIVVTGAGHLWLLAPADQDDDSPYLAKAQTVALDITLQGGTLTFDMPSDDYTVIVDDSSSIDLNGGTLQISDGTVLVSAAEYATWNVAALIVNSTLAINFRDTDLDNDQISSLVSQLDAATSDGNSTSAVRFLVANDAQAEAVFQGLQLNLALMVSDSAPRIDIESTEGVSVAVNIAWIIESRVDFLAQGIENRIAALKESSPGDYDAADYKTIADLSAAISQLSDDFDAASDANNPESLVSRLATLETALGELTEAAVTALEGQLAAVFGGSLPADLTSLTSLETIAGLKAAVEALQEATGAGEGSLGASVTSLENGINTLITQILAGPGVGLTVAQASSLADHPLGADLIANYRIIDTADNIMAAAGPVLSGAKSVIINQSMAVTFDGSVPSLTEGDTISFTLNGTAYTAIVAATAAATATASSSASPPTAARSP